MDHHDPEFLKRAAEARSRITLTPPEQVDALRAHGAVIIDVREAEEHSKGHVQGAINLHLDDLTDKVLAAVPDKDATVICYCNGGNRGGIGADTLQTLGYRKVLSIDGGLRAYTASKLTRSLPANAINPSAVYVLDVRREADYAASNESLPGAHWKNPEHLAEWTDSLPQDQAIVLYCVRGGAVSNSVVDALQAKGLQARYIDGGIEGWKAAGGEVVSK
jgi:rhodanese-related sulfurtransferase